MRVKTKTVIEHFGGVAKLAKALNISRAAIYQWGDEVPDSRVYEIHVRSGGVLTVDGMPPTTDAAPEARAA